jgi:hypothetical protein
MSLTVVNNSNKGGRPKGAKDSRQRINKKAASSGE